jgi:hypothetical protein
VLRLQREPHGQVLQSRGQALLQERLLQVIIQIFGSLVLQELLKVFLQIFGPLNFAGTTSSGNPTDIWVPRFCRNDFVR